MYVHELLKKLQKAWLRQRDFLFITKDIFIHLIFIYVCVCICVCVRESLYTVRNKKHGIKNCENAYRYLSIERMYEDKSYA